MLQNNTSITADKLSDAWHISSYNCELIYVGIDAEKAK